MKKTIGIIGGMGPLATAKLFERIVINSGAASDQEHPRIIIDNNTSIPDRTGYILGKGSDPRPELIKTAVGLESMGADFLVMPCNTAHYFLEDIKKSIGIPILDMVEATVEEAYKKSEDGLIGLLATEGTVRTGIYLNRFKKFGLKLVLPDKHDQDKVMNFIYGIKSGDMNRDLDAFKGVVESMADNGIKTVIMGCTELSAALDYFTFDSRINYLDPLSIIARKALLEAGCVIL
jgi:aspartate racemase